MVIPPEQFEPPLERDPRVLSFRFLLSNSPAPRHGATRCPAALAPATLSSALAEKAAPVAAVTARKHVQGGARHSGAR